MAVIKRHSFLKRHAGMTRPAFSRHYLEHHGPLAAGLGGFRQFAYRYLQNHFDEDFSGDGDPPFDGLTMTFQVPRPDYRRASSSIPTTPRSGRTRSTCSTCQQPCRCWVRSRSSSTVHRAAKRPSFSPRAGPQTFALPSTFEEFAVRRAIRNRLDTKTATALGFGPSAFAWDHLWEVFFASADRRQAACKDPRFIARFSSPTTAPAPRVLAAREYTIF